MRKCLILIILLFCFSMANAGQLRVLSPFISTASVSDGTIGNKNYGATVAQGYTGNIYYDKFTGSAGTIGYGHIYMTNDGKSITVCLSIFDSSGTEIQSGSANISSLNGTGWVNIQLFSTTVIDGVSTYSLGYQCDTNFNASNGHHITTDGSNYYYDVQSYSCGGNHDGNDVTIGSKHLAIYFDNNAGNPS